MNINIGIEDKIPTVFDDPVIVCGNSDYQITFDFDSEWDEHEEKTARFRYFVVGDEVVEDVPFTGDTVDVPIITNTLGVKVGVFAGELSTTAPTWIPCKPSILCGGNGSGVIPPAPDSVRYAPQERTEKEKEIARQNTGAAAQAEVDSLSEEIDEHRQAIGQFVDINVTPVNIDSITNVTKALGCNSNKLGNPTGIQYSPMKGYDTYWWISDKNCEVYFGDALPAYVSFTIAKKYIESYQSGTTTVIKCEEAGVRYRKSESNLPTETNKISVSAGDAITVTLTSGSMIPLYGYDDNRAYVPKEITGRRCYVQYHTAADAYYTEYISIYLPTNTAYIKYNVVHTVNDEINANVWRVDKAYICDNNLQNDVAITTAGEWEIAVHLANRTDFSGGKAHGDELLDTVAFYLDGMETDVTTLTELTPFNEFLFVQKSNLYDPNDGVTLIAEHGSEHIFTEKMTINQSLKWKIAETLTYCYMAMLPISKAYADKFYTDANYSIVEMTGQKRNIKNARTANILADNGLHTIFSVPVYPSGFGNDAFLTTDNTNDQSGVYNKCYFTITPENNTKVSTVDELWKSQTIYDFKL